MRVFQFFHVQTFSVKNQQNFRFVLILCVCLCRLMLQYLYTGALEVHIDQVESVITLAKHCHLQELLEELEDKRQKLYEFGIAKPSTNVTVISIEQSFDSTSVHDDLGVLAEQSLPVELAHWVSGSELPFYPSERSPFADICFEVEKHLFMCHKSFFCSRCDYFRALTVDHFSENPTIVYHGVPVVRVHNIPVNVFVSIIYYMYQDNAYLTDDNVYDVLCTADMLLLPGLKRQCGAYMSEYLNTDNVTSILRTARLFQVSLYPCQIHVKWQDYHSV